MTTPGGEAQEAVTAFAERWERHTQLHNHLPKWTELPSYAEPPVADWRVAWRWPELSPGSQLQLVSDLAAHVLRGEQYVLVDGRMEQRVLVGDIAMDRGPIWLDELTAYRIARERALGSTRWDYTDYLAIYHLGQITRNLDPNNRMVWYMDRSGIMHALMRPWHFSRLTSGRPASKNNQLYIVERGLIVEASPASLEHSHRPTSGIELLIHPILVRHSSTRRGATGLH